MRLFFSILWFVICVGIAFGCLASTVILGQVELQIFLKVFLMLVLLFGAYIWMHLIKFCKIIM